MWDMVMKVICEIMRTLTVCVRCCLVSVTVLYVSKLLVQNWSVLNQSQSWIGTVTSLFTWPVIVIVLLALFIKYNKMQELLEAVVNFVNRSRYGSGDMTTNNINSLTTVLCSGPKPTDEDRREKKEECLRFETYALMKLQQVRQCLVQRNVRMFKRGFSFDGGFSDGKTTFGVEVKLLKSTSAVHEVVNLVVRRVNVFYSQIEKGERRRFAFVLCLGVDEAVDRALIAKLVRDSICPIDVMFLDRTMPDFYEVFGK